MKFEPLGIQWIQSFGGRSKEAPHSPTMKNLHKQNPPLEIITLFGDAVHVTLDRPSKAELGLPLNDSVQHFGQTRGSIHCTIPACLNHLS
jgi:hypothetical protein